MLNSPWIMRRCDVCGVHVPEAGSREHRLGRRHNSFRFHGDGNHSVSHVEVRNSDGARVRLLRPPEVPDRVVCAARVARDLVVPQLVDHTGVACFQRVCKGLTLELLCGAILQLEVRHLHTPTRLIHAPSTGEDTSLMSMALCPAM